MPRDTVEGDLTPVLREIGRLVVNFNAAEHALRRIAFLLIDARDERVGEITIDKLGAVGLEELVPALAGYRLTDKSGALGSIRAGVTRFGSLRLQRNRIVHAFWRLPNDSTDIDDVRGVHFRFRQGTVTTVGGRSPEPITKVATEAMKVSVELEDLYEIIRTALHEFESRVTLRPPN